MEKPTTSPTVEGLPAPNRITASDVEHLTGLTVVTTLALEGLVYFARHEGRWTVFLSSRSPERHQEVFEHLVAGGRWETAEPSLAGAVHTLDLPSV